MKNLKLALLTIAVAVMATGILLQAQPQVEIKQKISIEVIIGEKTPTPGERELMKVEEQSHPNIAKAMDDIKAAMNALDAAPDNFGGHKEQAQKDLQTSYVSLRKALYYRLYEDTH
jgi:hypothetical protein